MNTHFTRPSIVAIAILLAAQLAGCGTDLNASPTGEPTQPVPSGSPEPASPTESPSPSPSEPAGDRPLDEGWIEVGSFGADDAIETVSAVVEAPFGLLAAGVHISTRQLPVFGPLPREGRIWLSTDDGQSWADVTPSGTFADASVFELATLPDGAVVAFAQFNAGTEESRYEAWETSDGHTWTVADTTLGASPVQQLAAGGSGYVARLGSPLGDPQLTFAADGRTFGPAFDPVSGRIVTAIGAGPEGFALVASAYESAEKPSVYASGDGVEWFQATTPAWDVFDVAPLGPDWIVVERGPVDPGQGNEVAAAWLSQNGLDWVEAAGVGLGELDLGGGQVCREFLSGAIGTGQLVVVSSTLSYPCGEGHVQRFGASHITSDGATWTSLPFTGGAAVSLDDTRGTTVTAGVDLDAATVLAGEKDYRATFWIRAGH